MSKRLSAYEIQVQVRKLETLVASSTDETYLEDMIAGSDYWHPSAVAIVRAGMRRRHEQATKARESDDQGESEGELPEGCTRA